MFFIMPSISSCRKFICGNRLGFGGGRATVEAACGGLGVPTGVSTLFIVGISSPKTLWFIFLSILSKHCLKTLAEKTRSIWNRYWEKLLRAPSVSYWEKLSFQNEYSATYQTKFIKKPSYFGVFHKCSALNTFKGLNNSEPRGKTKSNVALFKTERNNLFSIFLE